MLTSLIYSTDFYFDVYLLHTSISDKAMNETRCILKNSGSLIMIKACDIKLDNAPTTSLYPQEMYSRILAAKYLPDTIDRILYLDSDIIVNSSIKELYNLPMNSYYFAAASHIGGFMQKINGIRLDMDDESPYINSGVMLMNIERLKKNRISIMF